MKTTKKALSILLAVLLCVSCFSLCLNAAAVTELSSIDLTCPAPAAGGAFPTVSDIGCAAALKVNSIYIYEVQGNTSVKATAPFEAGKTYEIDFAVATRTSSYNFVTNLSASVNDEACRAVYLSKTTANVVWVVTVAVPDAVVTVEAMSYWSWNTHAGTVTGGGSYPVGTEVTLTATPDPDYVFCEWRIAPSDGARYSVKSATYTFTVTADTRCVAYIESEESCFHLSGVAEPQAGGTVTGSGWCYREGSLEATANEGWYFVGWYDGETFLSAGTSYNLQGSSYTTPYDAYDNGEEVTVTAKFVRQDACALAKDPKFDDLEVGDWFFDLNEYAKNALLQQSETEISAGELEDALFFIMFIAGGFNVSYVPDVQAIITETGNIGDSGEDTPYKLLMPGVENYDLVRDAIHQADRKVVQTWVTVEDPWAIHCSPVIMFLKLIIS